MHEKYIGKWLTIGKHVVQIQSMIGEGGTAYIYKATEQRSNKPCAVKMLLVQTSVGFFIIVELSFCRKH